MYCFQTLTLFALFILCMSYPDLQNIFLSKPYFCLCFCVHRFALQWLPDFIPLGTSALQTFGLYQLSLSFPTCLMTFWFNLSLRQQQLRSNCFPTMRRNLTIGSASSRHSSQRQGSNLKNINMPMLYPTCPIKSFGTFSTHLMSATSLTSLKKRCNHASHWKGLAFFGKGYLSGVVTKLRWR